MSTPRFGLTVVFAQDQLGFLLDPTGAASGDVKAKCKWNSDHRRYCIPNELICGDLGRFLGLPIPRFAVALAPQIGRGAAFASMDFNHRGGNLSPVLGDRLAASLPRLSAGILAFDVLVANADRHSGNLAVDRMDHPGEVQVFDHDYALFATKGIERLAQLQRRLGITDSEVTQGNRHILLDSIKTTHQLSAWVDQICNIPESYIRRVCFEATQYGLTEIEAEAAAKFLIDRKYDLRGIINRNLHEFRGLTFRGTV